MGKTYAALPIGVLLAGFAASACGDDGGARSLSADEERYAEAIAATAPPADATEDETNCAAAVVVAEVGVDGFREEGLEPEDIDADFSLARVWEPESDDDVERMVGGFDDCGIIPVLAVSSLGALATEPLTDEHRECLTGELSDDAMREIARAVLAGEGPVFDPTLGVNEALRDCDVDTAPGG